MSTTVDTNLETGILTIDQAAAYLAIPKATLYTWRTWRTRRTRRGGFGPRAVKMGGCLRFRRSDLDAWVVDHLEDLDEAPVVTESWRGKASPTVPGVSLSRASRTR